MRRFYVSHLLLGVWPILKINKHKPNDIPLKKTKFSFMSRCQLEGEKMCSCHFD